MVVCKVFHTILAQKNLLDINQAIQLKEYKTNLKKMLWFSL